MRSLYEFVMKRGPDKVFFAYADNIPEGRREDFYRWMFENQKPGQIMEGVGEEVYRGRDIKEYLQMNGIPVEEIVGDYGHLIREQVGGLGLIVED